GLDLLRPGHDPGQAIHRDRAEDITFRQVHREDGGRIRFRRVCSLDGEEVPYEDIAKGFELPSGEIVVLTDDDMADLPLPTLRSIEVLYFAPETDIDPI